MLFTGGGTPAPALLQQGVSALNEGHTTVAEARFDAVIAKDSSNVEALYDLGVIYQKLDNPAIAATYYNKALLIDPNYQPALYNLAIEETFSHPSQAISLYEKVLGLSPNDANALWNLGLLLIAQGQSTRGHSDLEKAIFINPALKSQIPPGLTP